MSAQALTGENVRVALLDVYTDVVAVRLDGVPVERVVGGASVAVGDIGVVAAHVRVQAVCSQDKRRARRWNQPSTFESTFTFVYNRGNACLAFVVLVVV